MENWNSIVPQPESLKLEGGSCAGFAFTDGADARVFQAEAEQFCRRHPELRKASKASKAQKAQSAARPIRFLQEEGWGEEGYRIQIAASGLDIYASAGAGAFYATMTLSQWLWQHGKLPLGELSDRPRFVWRGFMLDVARHFFPVSYIKQLMAQLASYKINRLHLHLTDDQGWRLPSVAYPKLSRLGSRRYEAFDHIYAGAPGGRACYSKKDLAELNALAAKLHMLIVPEIDLPGHATAALACYPELQCEAGKELRIQPLWGISRNVLCLAKPETWDFVYAVLAEVADLFPRPYMHLGGDEVPEHNWKNCSDCQDFLRREGQGAGNLQNLFTRRSRDYVKSLGKTPLYWDEVEESGLSEGTVSCFWRSWQNDDGHDADWDLRAAQKGVPVISCPVNGAYFDYKHLNDVCEAGNLGVNSVFDAYHFLPLADKQPELAALNLGVQANLWTEYVCYPSHAEYMIYPRLLAIAEQGWRKGGWAEFQEKWPLQERVLQSQGVRNYYRGAWA